jgi:hypothetical protein
MEETAPILEGSSKCIEWAIVDTWQGLILQLGVGQEANNN